MEADTSKRSIFTEVAARRERSDRLCGLASSSAGEQRGEQEPEIGAGSDAVVVPQDEGVAPSEPVDSVVEADVQQEDGDPVAEADAENLELVGEAEEGADSDDSLEALAEDGSHPTDVLGTPETEQEAGDELFDDPESEADSEASEELKLEAEAPEQVEAELSSNDESEAPATEPLELSAAEEEKPSEAASDDLFEVAPESLDDAETDVSEELESAPSHAESAARETEAGEEQPELLSEENFESADEALPANSEEGAGDGLLEMPESSTESELEENSVARETLDTPSKEAEAEAEGSDELLRPAASASSESPDAASPEKSAEPKLKLEADRTEPSDDAMEEEGEDPEPRTPEEAIESSEPLLSDEPSVDVGDEVRAEAERLADQIGQVVDIKRLPKSKPSRVLSKAQRPKDESTEAKSSQTASAKNSPEPELPESKDAAESPQASSGKKKKKRVSLLDSYFKGL